MSKRSTLDNVRTYDDLHAWQALAKVQLMTGRESLLGMLRDPGATVLGTYIPDDVRVEFLRAAGCTCPIHGSPA